VLSRDDLILATGTVGNPPLETLVEAAQAGAYRGLSIWPVDVAQWRADGLTDAQARARFEAAGLVVAQQECLLRWPKAGSPETVREENEVFDVATALGAWIVSILSPGDDRFSEAELADAMAGVCERGAERGLEIALEVAPWKGNVDLPAAVRIIEQTGQRNARLVIDSWHMYRGHVPAAQLAAIPAGRVSAIQLSDAPSQPGAEVFAETMGARLLPGDGDCDLESFLSALDANAGDVPITVEVLSDEIRAGGPIESASRTAAAARKTLAAHATRRDAR
jgi:sugar phosphate isomerase/epimerase